MIVLLRALDALLHSGFPFVLLRRDRMARQARSCVRRRWPLWLRPLALVAMTFLWPLSSLVISIRIHRRASHAPEGFWLKAWAAALLRNIPPTEYADYQLFHTNRPERWLFSRETALWLGRETPEAAAALISDKVAFAAWLARRGVPVPGNLRDPLPRRTIVVKPQNGVQGSGISVWHWREGAFHGRAGFGKSTLGTASEAELRQQFPQAIFQPTIQCRFGIGAVARIVTTKEETLDALIQVPAAEDFCSHRGPFRLVDLETGQVLPPGPGQTCAIDARPVGEMPIEGQVLPGWHPLLARLTAAHAAMDPPPPVIGWDVMFQEDEAVVLEGNTGIGFHLFQLDRLRPSRIPGSGGVW